MFRMYACLSVCMCSFDEVNEDTTSQEISKILYNVAIVEDVSLSLCLFTSL